LSEAKNSVCLWERTEVKVYAAVALIPFERARFKELFFLLAIK